MLTAGPLIDRKEWVQLVGSFVILMLGTINVRMAAMRERQPPRLRQVRIGSR